MRILLVESNPANARLLCEHWLAGGNDQAPIRSVSNLSAGLECLTTDPIDVVLLNLNLNDCQGLLSFNRLHACAADVPVVLVVDPASESLLAAALQAGVQDYLTLSESTPALLRHTLNCAVERQRSAAVQRKADARLETLVENIPDGFFILDEHMVCTHYNRVAAQLLGRPADEVVGRALFEAFPEARGSIFDEKYTFAIRNQVSLSFETFFEVSPFRGWYLVRVSPFDGGILVHFQVSTIRHGEPEDVLRQARDENQRLFQAEREQRELAETMRDMVALLVSFPDQETIFRRLLELVSRVVPYDEATIFLIVGDRIKAIQWTGYERFYPQAGGNRPNYRIDDVPNLRYMLETGLPVVNPDTYSHPNWIILPNTAHIRSYAGVPLRIKRQVIGFLNVHSTKPGLYNQTYLERLAIFGDEVSIALENVRLLEETRQRISDLEAINRFSAGLRMVETLDEMLPALMARLLEVVDARSGAIFMLDETTNALTVVARRGSEPLLPVASIQAGDGSVGRVFQSGETLFMPPSNAAPGDVLVSPETGALYLPLHTTREIFGVVVLAFQAPRQPTTNQIHLLETLVDIAGNTFHRMRLYKETETRLQHLSALRTIDLAIATSFDLRVALNVLLDQTLLQLKIDAADILLCHPVLQMLEYAAGRGFRARAIEQAHLQIGQGFAGQAALEGRAVFLADIRDSSVSLGRFDYLSEERFVTYIGVPLIIKGEVKGVLELYARSLFQPGSEWRDFSDALARQAAIAIDNAQLFENLQRSRLELAMAYDHTLEGWSRALDMRDKETEGHTQRVTELTIRLTRRHGFSESDLVHVRRGAILHDIGKMGVPDQILLKPGPLTSEEMEIMRLHPTFAMELLAPITYLRPALDIPYNHHEYWDGRGYPRGLKGLQIPKAARIFAIVDVWDALSHDRIYKKAWPREAVLAHLWDESGKHFDPEVVRSFVAMLEEEGDQI